MQVCTYIWYKCVLPFVNVVMFFSNRVILTAVLISNNISKLSIGKKDDFYNGKTMRLHRYGCQVLCVLQNWIV